MLCLLYYIIMGRGKSGRIVIEIDPTSKNDLYVSLAKDGLTLKEWFLMNVKYYQENRSQLQLFNEGAPNRTKKIEDNGSNI